MNLQQLEYIVAVDTHRHFAKAAENCFVTQPTLSMMIKKFEEDTGVIIFDRGTHPITPSREGIEIIKMARFILSQVRQLESYTKELKGEIAGTLRLGIIPTLAPYLLPLIIRPLSINYPNLHIYLKELVTTDIIQQLKTGDLDAALLATPLHESMLNEHHLFNEEFLAYAATKDALHKNKLLLPNQIDPAKLWLLEEGHCLRTQVLNLCELKKSDAGERFHYEAGSIETLINLVDKYEGITIIPELALLNMKPHQKAKVLRFAPPAPVREISLVTHETYPRKAIIQAIKAEVAKALPFKDHTSGKILEITN